MLKKICFIIILLIIGINTNAISIDGVRYSTEFDFSGGGFSYKRETNTLELNNYNGGLIKENNNLNIVLLNNNKISCNDNTSAIDVKKLNISGPGKLEINSNAYGITAHSITINNATIVGKSKSYFINCKYYDLTFDNVNITSESDNAFMYAKGNSTINNSIINAISESGFLTNDTSSLKFNNSKLDIRTNLYVFNGNTTIKLENTSANLKSNNRVFHQKNLNVFGDYNTLVSNDDINYINDLEYLNYKYMKVIPSTSIIEDNSNSINEKEDVKNENIDPNNNKDETNIVIENDYEKKDEIKVNNEKLKENNETNEANALNSNVLTTIENPQTGDYIYYYITSFIVLIFVGLFIIKLVKREYYND